jgi:hypothetical protein
MVNVSLTREELYFIRSLVTASLTRGNLRPYISYDNVVKLKNKIDRI